MVTLLFNLYLSDLFLLFSESNVVNYADDSIPYATARYTELVINKLEGDSKILFQRLSFNVLEANPEKSHLLLNSTDTSLFALIIIL